MSIDLAEQLKAQWTDKYVTVREGVPELRRFVGFVGQVKTVNMNCRALVEFDSPEDISWYDIDPSFLTIANAPEAKAKAAAAAGPANAAGGAAQSKAAAADTAAAVKKVSAADMAGLSPLEKARLQGAASKGGSASTTTSGDASALVAAPKITKPADDAAASKAASPEKAPAENTSGLSPLELARQQGAAGSGKSNPAPGTISARPASTDKAAAPGNGAASDD
ncbi:hypothetical protein OAH18_03645, partial [bacterium]|nr:hypothetical protein [bacterium]